ncbi:MAG TPA: UDP-N-acetylmuramoyl-tripeptide--D-alanyl-D-alanine ligase [Bacilli bacterium]|nr:UDP-N-acetylmuramoyl-tripeptide--D-alanyl-D-alanine ligase [Bacilli bacterium]
MINITIKDVLEKCNGKLISGDESLECLSFSKDTRDLKEGDIYLGIKGANFDGNKFYKDAFAKGAKACILDCNPDEITEYLDKTIVVVPDTIKCIQILATYKREMYNIPVVAITGSVGKTTTREMIAEILSKKYKVLTPIKNYNNHIGLPFTLLNLKDETACVLEMGMNHFGEISLLSKIAKPTISVITNIGTSHIGNLGSKENILKAKLEILDGMNERGILVLSNDDEYLKTVSWPNKVTVSINNDSNYIAQRINDYKFKVNNLKIKNKNITSAFIYNALDAIAVSKLLKVNNRQIRNVLNNFSNNKKRLQIEKSKSGITIIDDSYNASYESIKVALEVIQKYKNRKVVVLGDIKELGDKTIEIHQSIGDLITNIDILVTVGEYTKYIKSNTKNENFNTNEEAIKYLKMVVRKDDVVLVKASNAMNFEEIVKALIEI